MLSFFSDLNEAVSINALLLYHIRFLYPFSNDEPEILESICIVLISDVCGIKVRKLLSNWGFSDFSGTYFKLNF